MIFSSEIELQTSIFKHIPPAIKFLSLFLLSLFIFWFNRLDIMVSVFVLILLLYSLASIPFVTMYQQLRSLWWIFALLFIFHLFTSSFSMGIIALLRYVDLLLFASLITLTTPILQMMKTLEHAFVILKPFGICPEKLSFTIAMTIRFIPLLQQIIQEIGEAQKARGLTMNSFAIAVPLIIRVIKMADTVACAVEVRGFEN